MNSTFARRERAVEHMRQLRAVYQARIAPLQAVRARLRHASPSIPMDRSMRNCTWTSPYRWGCALRAEIAWCDETIAPLETRLAKGKEMPWPNELLINASTSTLLDLES